MNYYLAKTDPETYSISDLKRDKKTVWDGVHNFQAIAVIKTMQMEDLVLIYHSMGEAAIVGIAKIISEPRDAKEKRPSYVVDVEFVKEFEKPVTLKEIKESHLFDDWSLIKQSRLSTMKAPDSFIEWLNNKGYKI